MGVNTVKKTLGWLVTGLGAAMTKIGSRMRGPLGAV